MKHLISIILLILPGLSFYGQASLQVVKLDTNLGKNLKTNSEIKVVEYKFPSRVFDFYPDSTTGLMTVQLRNTSKNGKHFKYQGKLVLYDPEMNSIKWEKKINYQKQIIKQYDDILLQLSADGTSRLNMATGQNIYTIPSQLAYVNSKTGTGMGYQLYNTTDKLNAYDMKRGSVIWFRGIDKEFGWNDIINLNDSVILLLASGIHCIDLKLGDGWDYKTVTGSNDYTSTILLNTLGILMTAASGYGYMYTGYDVNTDLISNVILDEDCLYFASRECIASLDYEGNVLWKTELPKKKTSKSAIFISDHVLYMINLGIAYRANHATLFEKPYIAAFDQFSGQQIFLNEIIDKKEAVNDFLTGNGEIVLLFNDRIEKYSMNDGALLSKTYIDSGTLGKLMKFATDEIYVKKDSLYKSPVSYDSLMISVVTDSLNLIYLSDDYTISAFKTKKDLYFPGYKKNDVKFLYGFNNSIIVDVNHNKIAEINTPSGGYLRGNFLYTCQNNSILQIDLRQFLKPSLTQP